jgi:uncharacterized membrane protein YfcA
VESLGITPEQALVVAVVSFAGGVMRGFSGFGSALVIAPVLSLAISPVVAVPAVVLVHLLTTAQLVPGTWRDIVWPRIVPLSIAGCLGVPVGVYALVATDPEVMRRAIAAATILFATVMLTGWRYTAAPGRLVTAAVGGAGGVLAGAGSIGGPPVILFLLAGPDRAATNRATFVYYFLFTQLAGLAVYWIAGILALQTLLVSFVMAPTLIAGTWLGSRLFGRASEELFRRAALVFLLAIGIAALAL